MLLGMVCLTGCQNIKGVFAKRDNGSLDYTHAKKLDPIRLPAEQETMPFVPLYQVPNVSGEGTTMTDTSGKQYQLPTPPRVAQ